MLKNLFAVYSGPDDIFRTGQIVEDDGSHVLVRFDNMKNPRAGWNWPMEVVCREEIAHATLPEGMKCWGLFRSRAELDAYLAWLDLPDDATESVVKLVKH